jgi:hypothetical protein
MVIGIGIGKIDKVAASVVLTEELADMIDDEMRKLRLPSRAAMIRVAIEDYFTPNDTAPRDYAFDKCNIELINTKEQLESATHRIDVFQQTVDWLRGECEWLRSHCDELTRDGSSALLGLEELEKLGNNMQPPRQVIAPPVEFKEVKYRNVWYQFWLPKLPKRPGT